MQSAFKESLLRNGRSGDRKNAEGVQGMKEAIVARVLDSGEVSRND